MTSQINNLIAQSSEVIKFRKYFLCWKIPEMCQTHTCSSICSALCMCMHAFLCLSLNGSFSLSLCLHSLSLSPWIQFPLVEPQKPLDSAKRASTYLLANYLQHFLFRCLQWQRRCLCWKLGSSVCQGASRSMCKAPDQRTSQLMCQLYRKG